MARIKLIVAYDGTDFSGWQLQPRDRTVQGELETAITEILGRDVRVHGSGRTDSGVHAMGQAAHFDCPEKRRDLPWAKALNGMLPKDVRVLSAVPVPDDFHVRYSALSKTYEYTLWHKRHVCLPQRRRFVWDCGAVDFDAMQEAARRFMGEHDFSAFQNMGTPVKTTVRTMTELSLNPGETDNETVWRFSANGFLKQMVRNIMGCLVAVGRGKLTPDDAASILASTDRTLAPATAPPQGLSLISVTYPPEID